MTANAPGAVARPRILLGHLGARGDCVYATVVARQIKHDFPGCHLTWAVGSMARSIVDGHPDVDEIWEIPVANHDGMLAAWDAFMRELAERQARADYDHVFLTQIFPDNFHRYDGTVRASIFRGYPHPITVPVTPVIRLSNEELRITQGFVERHRLRDYDPVILFESGGGSGQTFVDLSFSLEAAREIIARLPGAAVVISSAIGFESDNPRMIDASSLPFRCNAELTRSCTLLVGCSSGISWLATSDWAKPLPKIQLLRRATSVYASFVHDHERFGLPTDQIIEITDCPPARVAECVEAALARGFPVARQRFHESIPLDFSWYLHSLLFALRRSGLRPVLGSLVTTIGRYGPHPRLLDAAMRLLALAAGRTWRKLRGTESEAYPHR